MQSRRRCALVATPTPRFAKPNPLSPCTEGEKPLLMLSGSTEPPDTFASYSGPLDLIWWPTRKHKAPA